MRVQLSSSIASCNILGSSDATITDVTPNDIRKLLENSKITRIFANGNTAAKLYAKYIEESTGIPAVRLPSTSPANAAWSEARLVAEWGRTICNEY